MNKWLINAELTRLQTRSYADLTAMTGNVETKEIVGDDGRNYQLKFKHFGTVKRRGSAGDGSRRRWRLESVQATD